MFEEVLGHIMEFAPVEKPRHLTCGLCGEPDPSGSYRRIYIAPLPLPMKEGIVVDVCYKCYQRNKRNEIFQYPEKPEVIFDEHDSSSGGWSM